MSQTSKILTLLRENKTKGVTNYQLASISLKYSCRISELRQDGHVITAIRQHLPNGRFSGTWRYYLTDFNEPSILDEPEETTAPERSHWFNKIMERVK